MCVCVSCVARFFQTSRPNVVPMCQGSRERKTHKSGARGEVGSLPPSVIIRIDVKVGAFLSFVCVFVWIFLLYPVAGAAVCVFRSMTSMLLGLSQHYNTLFPIRRERVVKGSRLVWGVLESGGKKRKRSEAGKMQLLDSNEPSFCNLFAVLLVVVLCTSCLVAVTTTRTHTQTYTARAGAKRGC